MPRFFSAKNSKWINLSLVREITRTMDGLTLCFDESDTVTLEGQDVQTCIDFGFSNSPKPGMQMVVIGPLRSS